MVVQEGATTAAEKINFYIQAEYRTFHLIVSQRRPPGINQARGIIVFDVCYAENICRLLQLHDLNVEVENWLASVEHLQKVHGEIFMEVG